MTEKMTGTINNSKIYSLKNRMTNLISYIHVNVQYDPKYI